MMQERGMPTVDLRGRTVLLSASFPSGEGGKAFEPYDVDAIADAVSTFVRAIFFANGRLSFGSHPTITPQVLLAASEYDQRGVVDVFFSEEYVDKMSSETVRLIDGGYGILYKVPDVPTLRQRMMTTNLVAGVFIGGMEGVVEEFHLFREKFPGRPCIPIAGPGGAARRLANEVADFPDQLRAQLYSQQYPSLFRRVVSFLSERA